MSPVKDSSSSAKDSAPIVVRRSKAMPIDSPTAKFLYTIIKQLDLKGIDWGLVASELEISNGHAARMRYHRFRNQMEGYQPQQRKRPANKSSSKASTGSCKAGLQKGSSPMRSPTPPPMTKTEPPEESQCGPKSPSIKPEQHASGQQVPRLATIPQYGSRIISAPYPHSQRHPHSAAFLPSIATPYHYQMPPLTPELRMSSSPAYSSTPPYPPVPVYETGYRSPVAWTPVKAEPRTLPEEYKGLEIAETSMVKEEVQDEIMIRND
ncbi:uncharacterized protein BDW70DRAFT_157921 [Aspergillus foveolatus]|uniref:uncharacterized protein n=1 Tax=Aspergillus foveolatus TaxID=210207 RepID=UPI003CCCA308